MRNILAVLTACLPLWSQGVIATIAGSSRVYPAGGVAANSVAVNPAQVAVAPDGTVYIDDPLADVILRVNVSGTLTVFAGNGISASTGDGGPATKAAFYGPSAIALDSSGQLLVGDDGSLRRVATDGTIHTLVPSFGALTIEALTSDQAGNVYAASSDNRVRRISANGTVTVVAGNGSSVYSGDDSLAINAGLNLFRSGLALDAAGNLYISDPGNQRIRRVSPAGVISTFAGNGSIGPSGDGGPATAASLTFPEGLAIDTDGGLLIADTVSNRVRRVSPAGIISTVAGNGNNNFSGDGQIATSVALNPSNIAVDSSGNIFIADTSNVRVWRVDRPTGIARVIAGDGNSADPADGRPATAAGLSSPEGVVADASGNIYVADTRNNRIRKFTIGGTIATLASPVFPTGIALSPSGELYFTDLTRVLKLTSGGSIQTVAGNATFEGFSGDGGLAIQAWLLAPRGLAFDSTGNLFIADSANHRIRRVDLHGVITTVVGNGTAGFSGDGGLATTAMLNYPSAVAFDASGNLLIADSQNNRVRRVDPQGFISTIAGNGSAGGAGDGGPASQAAVFSPCSLALGPDEAIYVATCNYPHIRRFTIGGTISTVAGAIPGFSGDGGSAAAANLGFPEGIAFDQAGDLLIADTQNDRIRIVLASAPTSNVSSTQLTFAGSSGGRVPLPQFLSVTTSVPGMSMAETSGASWLRVDPPNGFAPSTLRVTADPSTLAPGAYHGSITIALPYANPKNYIVNVSFNVNAAQPPKLGVETSELRLIANSNAQVTGSITVENLGGSALNFSVTTRDSWLRASPATGSAFPTQPAPIAVTALPVSLAPGVYSSSLTIAAATGETANVAVTLLVRPQKGLVLSQRGLSFQSMTGGSPPTPQSFSVMNRASGALPWTAAVETLSGGAWLNIGTSSGTANGPYADFTPVSVTINPTGLTAGAYYGLINVTSGIVRQSVMVVLDVLPPGSPPPLDVRPAAMVFTGLSPGSQSFQMTNPGTLALGYNSSTLTVDGGDWLKDLPGTAQLAGQQSQQVVVQPLFKGLATGIHNGAITLLFTDGSIRTIEVVTVIGAAGCTPSALNIVATSIPDQFPARAGRPVAIEAIVTDDCGNLIGPGASVFANFSSGDNAVSFVPAGSGKWTATWQPGVLSQGVVYITISAYSTNGAGALADQLVLEADISGPAVDPVLEAALSGASFSPAAPLAPGELVSLFGANMADSTATAGTLPLSTALAGAQVRAGNQLLPLLYSSAGQINAQIPFELPPNAEQQLIVQRGTVVSVPFPVVVAPSQPAVFTQDQSGSGAGIIVNASSTGASAQAGDAIVIYCTGLGTVTPPVASGDGAPGAASTDLPVSITIGGIAATVIYAGLTPGFPGLYQVNAIVPLGAGTGAQIPVVLSAAGQTSPPVWISLR
jgi:uncharacterized protein (TIGR03437 family)